MKKIYTAPSLTVVSIQVEKGYAGASSGGEKLMLSNPVRMSKSSSTQEFSEDYSLSEKWISNNDESFWGDR